MPENPITNLQGVSWKNAKIKILTTKLQEQGTVLVTHWGLSGPAVLRLSAWGARTLAEMGYRFDIQVVWLPDFTEDNLRTTLQAYKISLAKRQIQNKNPFAFPSRLWLFFLEKATISFEKTWAELNKKELNKLLNVLLYDQYAISGKTTFKEEFVTCGGITLTEIEAQTMQSKIRPNVFFAGEILDIDGITGGFNFQAAWATGFVAGESAVSLS